MPFCTHQLQAKMWWWCVCVCVCVTGIDVTDVWSEVVNGGCEIKLRVMVGCALYIVVSARVKCVPGLDW